MTQGSRLDGLSSAKHIVVLGLGPTGLSFVRYLHSIGINCTVNDSRLEPPGLHELSEHFPNTKMILGQFDEQSLADAEFIFISQGIATQEPAIAKALARGQAVVSDMELFAHAAKAPIIAITGSNAKSTVTTLVGQMLTAAGKQVLMGGNIGIPALDLLQQAQPDAYVLEVSNFQLDTSAYFPTTIACVLNISPDHLDRYEHYSDYIAAKLRIYRDCEKAIINRDDPVAWPSDLGRVMTSFGSDKPNVGAFGLETIGDQTYLSFGSTQLCPVSELKILGRHNWQNALAALAIAYSFGATFAPMLEILRTFTGLKHRCQWVATIDNVHWYNDSKGTNIGATLAAIQGFSGVITGKLILLLGGIGKGADFSLLANAIDNHVKGVVVFGKEGPDIAQALANKLPIAEGINFDDALAKAAAMATAGDTVLLSPACASFDMFKHYEHRGEVFTAWVLNYAKTRSQPQG